MKIDISQLITNLIAITIIAAIAHFTAISMTGMLLGALLVAGVFKDIF